MFGKYGHLTDVYIPLDYYTRRPRGFAYIQYPWCQLLFDCSYRYDIDYNFLFLSDLTVIALKSQLGKVLQYRNVVQATRKIAREYKSSWVQKSSKFICQVLTQLGNSTVKFSKKSSLHIQHTVGTVKMAKSMEQKKYSLKGLQYSRNIILDHINIGKKDDIGWTGTTVLWYP